MPILELPAVGGFPALTIHHDRGRKTMSGKPVFEIEVKTIINFASAFKEKLLCDGPTFSLGSGCAFKCAFCYVLSVVRRHPGVRRLLEMLKPQGLGFDDLVIRRIDALDILREQLTVRLPRRVDPRRRMVVFTSPLVDPAANMALLYETLEACLIILELTAWDIRILSKSNLLPELAKQIPERFRHRLIFGVSTGTLDDKLAAAFEERTPLVGKRLESLHWLQDNGFRTFGMICPNLPQEDYGEFSRRMAEAIRVDRCEYVWAEAINVRGDSLQKTVAALGKAGFHKEVEQLLAVSGPGSRKRWEEYAQATFLAHATHIPADKLKFLQYVNKSNLSWWEERRNLGAVLLGKLAHAGVHSTEASNLKTERQSSAC